MAVRLDRDTPRFTQHAQIIPPARTIIPRRHINLAVLSTLGVLGIDMVQCPLRCTAHESASRRMCSQLLHARIASTAATPWQVWDASHTHGRVRPKSLLIRNLQMRVNDAPASQRQSLQVSIPAHWDSSSAQAARFFSRGRSTADAVALHQMGARFNQKKPRFRYADELWDDMICLARRPSPAGQCQEPHVSKIRLVQISGEI